jgi:hypothetical protein
MNAELNDLKVHVVCDFRRVRFVLFVTGNTNGKEANLEQLGFKYTRLPLAAQEILNNISVGFCKAVLVQDKELVIKEIETLGFQVVDHTSDGDLLLFEGSQELAEEQNFVVRTDIPEQPNVIRGKKWNFKFYGKPGNWSIYPDGEKISISDLEKSKLDQYIKKLTNFEAKVRDDCD